MHACYHGAGVVDSDEELGSRLQLNCAINFFPLFSPPTAYSRMDTRGGNDKSASSRKSIRKEAAMTPPVGTRTNPHNLKQKMKTHGHFRDDFIEMCESIAANKPKNKNKKMRTQFK